VILSPLGNLPVLPAVVVIVFALVRVNVRAKNLEKKLARNFLGSRFSWARYARPCPLLEN